MVFDASAILQLIWPDTTGFSPVFRSLTAFTECTSYPISPTSASVPPYRPVLEIQTASVCISESELHQSSLTLWMDGFSWEKLENPWETQRFLWRCSEKQVPIKIDISPSLSFLASISRSEAFLRIVHQGLFQRGTDSGVGDSAEFGQWSSKARAKFET